MSNTQFKGYIGLTWEESKPWLPQRVRSAEAGDLPKLNLTQDPS